MASLPKGQQQQKDTEEPGFDKPYQYEQLDLSGSYLFEPVHVSKVIALEGTLGSERDESTKMEGLENLFPNANELNFAQPRILTMLDSRWVCF